MGQVIFLFSFVSFFFTLRSLFSFDVQFPFLLAWLFFLILLLRIPFVFSAKQFDGILVLFDYFIHFNCAHVVGPVILLILYVYVNVYSYLFPFFVFDTFIVQFYLLNSMSFWRFCVNVNVYFLPLFHSNHEIPHLFKWT